MSPGLAVMIIEVGLTTSRKTSADAPRTALSDADVSPLFAATTGCAE